MDMKSIAAVMYPYWLMGAFVLWATIKAGHKEVVRVEKKAVFGWMKFLVLITCYRLIMFKLFAHNAHLQETAKNVTLIPWPMTLTVFWEDACHGLPLLLLRNFIGTDKWWKWLIHAPLMAMVMLEFGLGHVYQGAGAAMLLSLYIPYSIHMGRKYGFGTVMVGHTLYDLTTILSLKFMLGL